MVEISLDSSPCLATQLHGWLRAREFGKRIQCYVCAIKLPRTGIRDPGAFVPKQVRTCSPASLVTQKFLLKEPIFPCESRVDHGGPLQIRKFRLQRLGCRALPGSGFSCAPCGRYRLSANSGPTLPASAATR